MRDIQQGRRFRAIRHRLGWRQSDVARKVNVSQSVISAIEQGRFEHVSLAVVRRVATGLDAEIVTFLRWRGGDLDRLMDEGHAALVGRMATMLRDLGWEVRLELSFSVYGERGSIDVLAWHTQARSLLVVEVKTELVAIEETLSKHDQNGRLAGRIAAERLGWHAATTSRLLVLPDLSTPRRRVERQSAVLGVAYPIPGAAVRSWLKAPMGTIAGLLFIDANASRGVVSRKRIRLQRAA